MISRLIVVAQYAALAGAAATMIVLGHRPGSRFVPLAAVLQAILVHRSIRIVIVVFWWWLGWHFLVEP